MKKLLLILAAIGAVGGGVWAITKAAAAGGCVMGCTECRDGDLWVCFGLEPIIGEVSSEWMLFEANSIYCSTTGPRGSIYGVTITPQEEPVDGVLVMVYNHDISPGWVGQISLAALPECFRFDNLPTGTYTVSFVADGYVTAEQQAVVTEGGETYVIGTMVAG